MQLVIKNNKVIATHPEHICLDQDAYPNCQIIFYDGHVSPSILVDGESILPNDPRTLEQKEEYYKDQRRLEYPPVEDQLDMLYHDTLDGTTVWVNEIKAVKDKYPKPIKV